MARPGATDPLLAAKQGATDAQIAPRQGLPHLTDPASLQDICAGKQPEGILNKKQEAGPPALRSWPFFYTHGVACDVFVESFKVPTFVRQRTHHF
jgi:hypothetical protein